ncbi:MAG: hypothetical protein IT292_08200 [Deltaproteobacteria bacterium]|nr:hypothetical protein [Deltaproteobacteria bacterium]
MQKTIFFITLSITISLVAASISLASGAVDFDEGIRQCPYSEVRADNSAGNAAVISGGDMQWLSCLDKKTDAAFDTCFTNNSSGTGVDLIYWSGSGTLLKKFYNNEGRFVDYSNANDVMQKGVNTYIPAYAGLTNQQIYDQLKAMNAYDSIFSDECLVSKMFENLGLVSFTNNAGTVTANIDPRVNKVTDFSIYLDSICNVVPQPAAIGNSCRFAFAHNWTPLSLVWDDNEQSPVAAKVDLTPEKEGWHIWRGSESLPLIVYDPENKGEIKGHEQFFGQHTFGKYFADGFDALASLDLDKNGKIENAEIAPLSLWFDKNKNGISDQGEVKRMQDLGIVSLKVTSDIIDTNTGDIYARSGFERLENGKKVTGDIVDWFSKTYASKEEAEYAIARMDSEKRFAFISPAYAEPVPAKDSKKLSAIIGAWKWTMDAEFAGNASGNVKGTFLFSTQPDGGTLGKVLVETAVESKYNNVKSMLQMQALSDIKKSIGINGSVTGHFEAKRGDTAIAKTVFTLSPDGNVMHGATNEVDFDSKDGTKEVKHYTWKAYKVAKK